MDDPDSSDSLPTQQWAGPGESAAPISPGSPSPSAAEPRRSGWQPPEPEQLQASFPLYEIRGILGRGGMGAVYQGWQKSLRRLVAIKILPPGLEDNGANFAERFQREAQAMARFSHPGIVSVYDAGETADGLFYFVMEYIEGTDVQKMVKTQGPLPPEHALAITAHVCDALAYAHKRGVIHRDIKPANIMVDAEGQVKVADFGLAKVASDDSAALVTGTNVSMGTADFMAPEALYGMGHVDHRADLYAVGVMLYQMLTGEVPRGLFDMPSKHRPGIDARFDEIVKRAMQKDPDKRYASATDIRTDLEKILTEPPPHRTTVEQASPASAPPQAVVKSEAPALQPRVGAQAVVAKARGPATSSRRWVWLTSGIAATLLLFAGGAAFFHDRLRKDGATAVTPPDDIERVKQPIPLQFMAGATPLGAALPADSGTMVLPYSDHRYRFVRANVPWVEARRQAEEMGGYLAMAGSKEENAQIIALIAQKNLARGELCWLGAEARKPNAWRWLDKGRPATIPWSTGEPHGRATAYPAALTLYNRSGTVILQDAPIAGTTGCFLVEWDDDGSWPMVDPSTATKDAPFINTLGMQFVPVPITGGPTNGQRVLFSIWETRVQDYEVFANETKHAWPKPVFEQGSTHPAVNVNWDDATAFCVWLTARERKAGKLGANEWYRLPTDHEWSCAVGIGDREDAAATPQEKSGAIKNFYPWGAVWPPPKGAGNFEGQESGGPAAREPIAGYRDDFPNTAPAGSFSANSLGLFDLGGNSWEWCQDSWSTSEPANRLLRGGAFSGAVRSDLVSSFRWKISPQERYSTRGFRIVLAPLPQGE